MAEKQPQEEGGAHKPESGSEGEEGGMTMAQSVELLVKVLGFSTVRALLRQKPEDKREEGGKKLAQWVELLVKGAGLVALAGVLLHMLGFVIVNTSLLRYGVYDFSILRVRFIAAGAAIVTWWSLAVVAAAFFLWLGGRLWRWADDWRKGLVPLGAAICALALLRAAYYVQHRLDPQAAMQLLPLYVWVYGCFAVCLAIGFVMGRSKLELSRRVTAVAPVVFLLVIIGPVSYGRYVHGAVPPYLGGGCPVYVQFVAKSDQVGNLKALGVDVTEDGALTQQMELLTETEDRLVVLTQEKKAVSFDASAVEGIRYDSLYYQMAERYYQEGLACLEGEDYENASDLLKQAIELKDDYPEAHLWYGVALMHIEDRLGDAKTEFNNVLSEEQEAPPDLQATAYYYRARTTLLAAPPDAWAQLDNGTKESVVADLKRGKDAHAETCRRLVERDGWWVERVMKEPADDAEEAQFAEFAEIARFIETVFLSRSAAASRYAAVGREYCDAKQPEDAICAYEAAIYLMTPEQEGIYRAYCRERLARVYLDLGDVENAKEQYRGAISDDPRNAFYHYRLAEMYQSQGEWEEVRHQCTLALEDDPEYIAAAILRGNAWRQQEQYDQAISNYWWARKRATRDEQPRVSDEALAHYERARLESRRAELDKAFDHLKQATSLSSRYILMAAYESDFDRLKADGSFAELLYPRVAAIEAVDAVTIRFKLASQSDTLLYQLAAAMRCEGLPNLLEYQRDKQEELIPGQARSWVVSDDGLIWTIELREDAAYTADWLAGRLGAILEVGRGGGGSL